MHCPVDNTQLTISDRQGIEIDYCPTCRGVWLDRGELDKLIERSNTAMPQRPAANYDDREHYRRDHDDDDDNRHYNNRDNHGQQKPHKKEGFLGDLFDF